MDGSNDLEHLFGGSDMSTAVKALYESGAPQEFFASLERFIVHKDDEIQQVCNHYYQQFIQSNQELVGVRVDIGELKQAVLKLNADIQSAGKDYLRECEKLVVLRRIRENSGRGLHELRRCCKMLEVCARVTAQLQAGEHYAALRALEILEQSCKTMPVGGHHLATELAERIPVLQGEIKNQVLGRFKRWL